MVYFSHFDFEMCFAPQRRALFEHLHLQKWSGTEASLTFCFRKVLPATTPCTFSTPQLPNVLRAWCAYSIFIWKPASRHNGVHFFHISTSESARNPDVLLSVWLRNLLCATMACNFSTAQLPKSASGMKCFWHFDPLNLFRTAAACNFWSLIWWDSCAPAALASLLFQPSRATIHWKNTVPRDFSSFSTTFSFFWFFLFSDLLSSSSLLFSDSSHLCFPICSYCRKFDF